MDKIYWIISVTYLISFMVCFYSLFVLHKFGNHRAEWGFVGHIFVPAFNSLLALDFFFHIIFALHFTRKDVYDYGVAINRNAYLIWFSNLRTYVIYFLPVTSLLLLWIL